MGKLPTELLINYWPIAATVIFVYLLLNLTKLFRSVVDTHDEFYLKRDLKRLIALKNTISSDSDLSKFIDKRIDEEAFVLASGIRATNEEMQLLTKLYLKNFLTKPKLKRVALYLKPVNGKIGIEFSCFDKAQVFYSFWGTIVLLLVGFSGLLPLVSKPSLANALFAFATFAASLIVIKFVGSDFQKYKTLFYVWNRLKADGALANPDDNIKTPWVYTPTFKISEISHMK